jgi:hypothetical protein
MASLPPNSIKTTDDQHAESHSSPKSSHESKKDSPTTSANIEEMRDERQVHFKAMKRTGISY